MAIKLVLAAILVASIHGQFPSNAQMMNMVRQQFQQPAAQPARSPQPVYQPPQPQQPVYQPPQQQYQPPAAPQPRQPMSPQQTYMNQMMTMNQNPNLRNQQNQMAQNVARNNPQLARGIAGMTSSFAQHMGQMNHQAPVQQAPAQPQPQPRVVSPFVPNQAQMAAFQSMFGGAKPAAPARPVAPVAPPKPRIDRRLSPCQYTLRNTIATKPTLTNGASGFTMKSRSRAGQVKAGSPVEVSIAPFSEAYQHLNFTSFIMYAKPTSNMAAVPEYMMEFMPPVAPTVNKHVGVFQVFRQYAAGAGAMKCSPTSKQEDSVGAFEDLILPESQPKPARNKVSVLWWPDAEALKYPEVIFTANIQSNGYWYKISSTPWKVIRPIDIQAKRERDFKRMNWMMQYMRKLERRLDGPPPA